MFTPEPTAPTADHPIHIPEEGEIPAQGEISLDAQDATQAPSETTATTRAVKAHIAIGDASPGVMNLRQSLLAGNESQVRDQMASDAKVKDAQIRMDAIKGIVAEAAKQGRPLSEQDLSYLSILPTMELQNDPKTILEKEYAHNYVNKVADLNDGQNVIQSHLQVDPEGTTQEMDVASNIKMRQEIVKTKIEDLNDQWKNTGVMSAIGDYAGSFVPLLENVRTHNVVEGANTSSILPGNNTDEQVQYLWTLPPKEFHTAFGKAIDELAAKNPLMAMDFANKVLSFSNNDRFLDNAFAIADVLTIPGVATAGKLALKGGEAAAEAVARNAASVGLKDTKVALKDAVKAEGTISRPVEEVLNRTGDLKGSARVTAYKEALQTFSAQDPMKEGYALKSQVPSLFNVDRVLDNSQSLSREASDRLSMVLQENAADLIDATTQTSKVGRVVSDEALQVGLKDAEARLATAYHHLNDAVLDTRLVSAEDQVSNVHEAEMRLGKSVTANIAGQESKPLSVAAGEMETALGKPDASLFKDRKEAEYWATEVYKLKSGEYHVGVEQKGVGYYVGVRTPINETADALRDVQLTTDHVTPRSITNTFLGLLKTPEDTLSVANREARHVATHGSQELHRYAVGVAENIGSLPNKSIKRLDRYLASNRDQMYLENGHPRYGKFDRDVGEFDRNWTSFHGKPPTEQERIAYFSAVQLNDWDYVMRNLGLYRDKARQGIEKFAFNHSITDETSGEKAVVKSPMIEGRVTKDIPWADVEDANIAVIDRNGNKRVLSKNTMTGSERAEITNAINIDGHKVIQVANPLEKRLRGVVGSDQSVHFIVAPEFERKALDWQQLPYRAGGHTEYLHEHWVSQPSIRRAGDQFIYEGDNNALNFATEAEARKYAEKMETARKMLKDGNVSHLDNFLQTNLPWTREEFTRMFQEQTLKDGTKLPARFSLEDPFAHRSSGRNVLDAHPDVAKLYPNVRNEVRSSYNLYGQIDKKFASERDGPVMTVRERTGDNEPAFKLEPAKRIDPLTTMNRAMANVMRSRYLNDYKIKSVEDFIEEFADLMKVEGGKAEIRKNPVFYLHEAPWDNQFPDKARLAAGKNAQRAIINLLGSQTELGGNLRWAREQMMNAVYNNFGQKASDYVSEHLLPVLKDPFKYARNVAFHSKLGLFNPVQMFLQSQTLLHAIAITPQHAYPGMAAASLMRYLTMTADKSTIEHFAQIASKFGWTKEDFLESYAGLKRSGLWNVEGEVALKDDIFDPKIFKGKWGSFLDKGTFFFREGERVVRLTAWNAAYREWKVANPGKLLNDKAIAEILTRQNTFGVNMTRASSSAWQQGLWSIPTQFFAYQARLAEQLLGKRLTQAEKARVMTMYAGMYGVPTATGAATFAYPWYDDMREEALNRGVDLTAPMNKALMDGIPSMIIQQLTGAEPNFSQRAGPGGIQYFKDVFKDGKVGELFGASPKILTQMSTAIAPVLKAVMSPFTPGEDFKLTMGDAITAMDQISTVNNVGKALFALKTGKYISQNETYLGNATTADAIMTALMGTQPLAISDAFLKADLQKETKSMQQAVQKQVITNWRRAMQEFNAGNDTAAESYMHNAKVLMAGGDFRPDEKGKIFQQAMKGYESFVDKMNREYIQKAGPSVFWGRVKKVFKINPDGTPSN